MKAASGWVFGWIVIDIRLLVFRACFARCERRSVSDDEMVWAVAGF